MPTPHLYDLVIGLDRSDKKADLCLLEQSAAFSLSALLRPGTAALRNCIVTAGESP